MAVLFLKLFCGLRRHGGKGSVRHVDEVAVTVFAVQTGQALAVHLRIAAVEIIVLTVCVAGIPEIKLKRIVEILAEIHQRVHFLICQRMLGDDFSLFVHHAGTIAGNGVIVPDAAQLTLFPDRRVSAASTQDELSACGLHLFDLLYDFRTGALLAERHKGVIVIACKNFVIHTVS